MKVCTTCGIPQEVGEYWKKKGTPDGLDYACRTCRKLECKESRERVKAGTLRPGGRPGKKLPPGERWCSGCQKGLPIVDFTGGERRCRKCKSKDHIRRKYGLDEEQYKNLVTEQGGKCAMCGINDFKYVDHDHTTGLVRGLLCPTCNTGLGYLETHQDLISNAKWYLAKVGS